MTPFFFVRRNHTPTRMLGTRKEDFGKPEEKHRFHNSFSNEIFLQMCILIGYQIKFYHINIYFEIN